MAQVIPNSPSFNEVRYLAAFAADALYGAAFPALATPGVFGAQDLDSVLFYWTSVGGTALDRIVFETLARNSGPYATTPGAPGGNNVGFYRIGTVSVLRNTVEEIVVYGAEDVFLRIASLTGAGTDFHLMVAGGARRTI